MTSVAIASSADAAPATSEEGPLRLPCQDPSSPSSTPLSDEWSPSLSVSTPVVGKSSGKGKVPPPGKAPPPRGGKGGGEGKGAQAALPSYQGPRPTDDFQATQVVNWQPIRHANRWSGSVWEQVHDSINKDGTPVIPDGLLNDANDAFMCKASEPRSSETIQAKGKKTNSTRRLPRSSALTADLNHAMLVRKGIRQPAHLSWVLGGKHSGEYGAISEETLEGVRGLLQAVASEADADKLCAPLASLDSDGGSVQELAPAESFLRRLLIEIGPLRVLQSRVSKVLLMVHFPAKADTLQKELQLVLKAVRSVLDSTAIPVLLQGVLMLGNYVNSSSNSLGGAVGVTLESLAKLAHTKYRPKSANGRQQQDSNALAMIVQHLDKSRPNFAETLAADLHGCRTVQHFDQASTSAAVQELTAQIASSDGLRDEGSDNCFGPDALDPENVRKFQTEAAPQIESLQRLIEDVQEATVALRRWLAEPTSSSLSNMLSGLSALRDALPSRPRPATRRPRDSQTEANHATGTDGQTSVGSSVSSSAAPAKPQRLQAFRELPSHEGPRDVVVQVLSYSAGRLSITWLFDWNAFPTELHSSECATKGFEILQCSDTRSDSEPSNPDIKSSWPCLRPPLEIQVASGQRYIFRVRAVLIDCAEPSASMQQDRTVVWASRLSAPIQADLRGFSYQPELRTEGTATTSSSSKATASVATNRRRSSSIVSSSLEAFLQEAQGTEAAPETCPSLPAKLLDEKEIEVKAPIASRRGRTTGFASGLDAFINQSKRNSWPLDANSSFHDRGDAVSTSASSFQHASQASSGRTTPDCPLATGMPRLVVAETHDPAVEKRHVAERLRLRSSELQAEVAGGSNPASPPPELQNGDGDLFEFDDDCLQRLTRALACLDNVLPEDSGPAKQTPANHNVTHGQKLSPFKSSGGDVVVAPMKPEELSPKFKQVTSEDEDILGCGATPWDIDDEEVKADDFALSRLAKALSSLERLGGSSYEVAAESPPVFNQAEVRKASCIPETVRRPQALIEPSPLAVSPSATVQQRLPRKSEPFLAAPLWAGGNSSPNASTARPRELRLRVQLAGEDVDVCTVAAGEEPAGVVENFFARNRLKEIFRRPLLEHVQALLREGVGGDCCADVMDFL